MNHAVIMGGSVAGLCAAAALSKTFDRVTVLERDPQPGPSPRKGVPQSSQAHLILLRGQQLIEELLPGTFAALERAGSRSADLHRNFRWFHFGAWKRRQAFGESILLQSRPLLEHHMRERLAARDNVTLRFNASIAQPIHEDGRVTGVQLQDGERVDADLVIDAMGRASRSERWLERWGCGETQSDRVELGLRYVSGVFEFSPGDEVTDVTAVYHLPPDNRRCGWIIPIEGNRAVITFVGYHGDHPPMDLESLREWAQGLLRPDVARRLQRGRLVSKLTTYNYKQQQRHLYHKLAMPQGYLIMGDALCSFDPTFGQGMTVAASQAAALRGYKPGASSRRWQRKLAMMTLTSYMLTTIEAHRWHDTTGWDVPLGRLQRWYLGHVHVATAVDDSVHRVFTQIMHMQSSVLELARPSFIIRTLLAARRYRALCAAPPPRREASTTLSLMQSGF